MTHRLFSLLCLLLLLFCCQQKPAQDPPAAEEAPAFTEVIKEDYELVLPAEKVETVLILFGGYPERAADIRREFPILQAAAGKPIAILFSNYNQKLWMTEAEKYALAARLQEILLAHDLPTDQVVIGGFSSGGVVSLLISNYIVGMKQFYLDPKGVFIVDSPIDLAVLYETAAKNVERNVAAPAVQEGQWLLGAMGDALGDPKEELATYEAHSVFTLRSDHTANLQKLKHTPIRCYTEPDSSWWKEKRGVPYEETNAFLLKKLSESLQEKGFEQIEYLPTVNRGYRANGERHPHSWHIVDEKELIQWIQSI